MIKDDGLSIITVQKAELLEALRKNREVHTAEFKEAYAGYKTAFIEELEKSMVLAKEGKEFRHHIALSEPADHTKDYDRVIRMLQMCVEENVQITEEQFNQYVMDDWGWKRAFAATNSAYIGKAR